MLTKYHPTTFVPDPAPAASRYPLWNIYRDLMRGRLVDLTHELRDADDDLREQIGSYNDDTGHLAHRYHISDHVSTHVTAPAHLVPHLRTIGQIEAHELLMPLAVIDISAAAAADPDYRVTSDDIRAWERRNGLIPAGALVALRTGWSRRWPDRAALENMDTAMVSHTPGWSFEALSYLCEDADVGAVGHETLRADPGAVCTRCIYPLERYILSTNRFMVSLLTNLHTLPEAGAIAIVAFPMPCGGAAFPARVLAITP